MESRRREVSTVDISPAQPLGALLRALAIGLPIIFICGRLIANQLGARGFR
jgi:hypothetical protein